MKILKYITEEIEVEYPIYLYFQDEDAFSEEFHKITKDKHIVLNIGGHKTTLEVSPTRVIQEYLIDERNRTTEEHFQQSFNYFTNKLIKDF
jgi:hypothetical protein